MSRKTPSTPVPLLAAARQAHQAGRLGEAIALYQRALAVQPGRPEILHLLGVALAQQGEPEGAIALISQAIAADPGNANYRCDIAPALIQLGRGAEAEPHLREAIRLSPKLFHARNNLGILLLESGCPDEALEQFEAALAHKLDFHEAALGRVRVHIEQNHLDGVEADLRRLLVARPGWPDALHALGKVLYRLDRLKEAEEPLCLALSANPRHGEALGDLGLLLMETERLAEAETLLRLSLEQRPHDPDARVNLGLLLLSQERYAEGWPYYESRLDPHRRQKVLKDGLPGFPWPAWRGEPIAGKSLLAWVEQGNGDVIQFCRYLPVLKRLGAARVSLCCYAPLVGLLEGLEGVDAVYPLDGSPIAMPGHDYWAMLLSLPGLTGELPVELPYLRAEPQALPSGFKVGLAWRGSSNFDNDRFRSLPGLESLRALWDVPGITFVSLQKGSAEDEAEHPPADQPILPLGAKVEGFAAMASLIQALDLVICVDTAVAHLAGALGKPCWVMLPKRAQDWRWGRERGDSFWYPGVVRLYRQQAEGDWDGVVRRVAAELATLPIPR